VEPLRRYYEDWYRPDLMAVIAVGDFDPDMMEREIKERFGKIPAAKDPRPREPIEVDLTGEPLIDILRDKVPPGVQILWPAPKPPSDRRAFVKQELVTQLMLGHMQEQIQRIRKQDRVPFTNAGLSKMRPGMARSMNMFVAGIRTWPDSLETGLAALLTELERVSRDGIPETALEIYKTAVLRQLEHEAARMAVRPSKRYVEEYSQHFLTGEGVLLSAEDRLALAREILPEITPEAVAEAARFWRNKSGLKVALRIPQFALGFRPPTEESVLAIFDSIQRGPLSPPPGAQGTVAASAGEAGKHGAGKGAGGSLL